MPSSSTPTPKPMDDNALAASTNASLTTVQADELAQEKGNVAAAAAQCCDATPAHTLQAEEDAAA